MDDPAAAHAGKFVSQAQELETNAELAGGVRLAAAWLNWRSPRRVWTDGTAPGLSEKRERWEFQIARARAD